MEDVTTQRVKLGVSWLDKNAPDWRSKVDVDKLDIRYPTQCILGQVFKGPIGSGYWPNGMDGFDYAWSVYDMRDAVIDYGFDAETFIGWREMKTQYANLTEQWKREVSDSWTDIDDLEEEN